MLYSIQYVLKRTKKKQNYIAQFNMSLFFANTMNEQQIDFFKARYQDIFNAWPQKTSVSTFN